MYKFERYRQLGLVDFNQPIGLRMDFVNCWGRKVAIIPWEAIEEKCAKLFPRDTAMPAKSFRMELGSLMIQKQYDYSEGDWWNRSPRIHFASISHGDVFKGTLGRISCYFMSKNATKIYWWLNKRRLLTEQLPKY